MAASARRARSAAPTAPSTPSTVYRNGAAHVPPHLSKAQDIPLGRATALPSATPGGGGYGDPLERDPALVLADVRLGYYTAEEARTLFGVALVAREDGLAVDRRATAALRATFAPGK